MAEPLIGERPWGFYRVHEQHKTWTLKTLHVKPDAQLSVQSHELRDETWLLVEGSGWVGLGRPPVWTPLQVFVPVQIVRRTIHALRAGPGGLVIVETMTGFYDEDDIKRFDDIYGRV